jgi:hypothetical protein
MPLKDIAAVKGRRYIEKLVAEGEHEQQDFKFMISDARKIARSVSAFANNSGGRLLIGVKDNGVVAGVRNEEDVYVVEQAAGRYCEPPQQVEFKAYRVDAAVTVIVASIARAQSRPVSVIEEDGRRRAYYRVADENIAAHPLMVEAWKHAEAEGGGVVMTLTGLESDLLRLVDGRLLDLREVAVGLHIAESRARSLIVRLAVVGLVDFVYTGNAFKLTRAGAGESTDEAR